MKCPYCGSEVTVDTLICQHCGRDAGKAIDKWENEGPPAKDRALRKPMFSAPLPRGPSRPPPQPWGAHEEKRAPSYFLLMGSTLVLLGGASALSEAIYIAAFASPSTIISSIPLPLGALAALMVVYGFFAIFGGALGMMRIYWPLAVLGAACSIAALGWSYLSALFGAIGLILIAWTREEFD
jgi:hypothetical protein